MFNYFLVLSLSLSLSLSYEIGEKTRARPSSPIENKISEHARF